MTVPRQTGSSGGGRDCSRRNPENNVSWRDVAAAVLPEPLGYRGRRVAKKLLNRESSTTNVSPVDSSSKPRMPVCGSSQRRNDRIDTTRRQNSSGSTKRDLPWARDASSRRAGSTDIMRDFLLGMFLRPTPRGDRTALVERTAGVFTASRANMWRIVAGCPGSQQSLRTIFI